jgi:hypothetical protein
MMGWLPRFGSAVLLMFITTSLPDCSKTSKAKCVQTESDRRALYMILADIEQIIMLVNDVTNEMSQNNDTTSLNLKLSKV